MKKLLIVIMLYAGISYADDPLSYTVGTNSIKIAANRSKTQSIPSLWVTATSYSQGALVLFGTNITFDAQGVPSDGTIYMALAAGTSSNIAPTHSSGTVSDGVVSWIFIPTGRNQRPIERLGLDVVNLSSNVIYVSVGADAEDVSGAALTTYGSSFSLNPVTQESIHVIGATTNLTVAVQRW